MAGFLFSIVPLQVTDTQNPAVAGSARVRGCPQRLHSSPRARGSPERRPGLFGFEVCWDERHPGSGRFGHSLINYIYNWGFVLKSESFESTFLQTVTVTEASDIHHLLNCLSTASFIPGPEILFWAGSPFSGSLTLPLEVELTGGGKTCVCLCCLMSVFLRFCLFVF